MSRLTRRLSKVSLRDLVVVVLPAALLTALGFWLAAQFIKPAPPDTLSLTSGSEGGAYQAHAARYKAFLRDFGVTLVERPSAGAQENLQRLLDPAQAVDAGFLQGGTVLAGDAAGLVSLGSLYYEPLWVFYRGKPGLTRMEQLAGRRLAVGAPGSGTRKLALELLAAHDMAVPALLSERGGMAAAEALRSGEVDAAFLVGPPRSSAVWLLLHMEGVSLLSFDQADAYTRRYPYLSRLVLPDGSISFPRHIPPRDVTLVAPMASLVVREGTHPALVDLLLQAMVAAHKEMDLFQKEGDFPSARGTDLPLSPRAERFYASGPPFLQRYLPFWVANFVDRTLVLLLPVVALLIPLMRVVPGLYSWRVRSRIYRWYGELKHLEMQAEADIRSRSREEWLTEVDRIERAVSRIPAPLAFTDFVYTLRSHVTLVRARLLARLDADGAKPVAAPAGTAP